MRYRNDSMKIGIISLYLKPISANKYWELLPHNKSTKEYPNIVYILELKLNLLKKNKI